MAQLTSVQKDRAIGVMQEYLSAPPNPDGRLPREVQHERDQNRVKLIEGELGSLVREYLSGAVELADFKSQIDGINKRNPYWGFRGIKGQMFFNMLLNVADDQGQCNRHLKGAIALPDGEDTARGRITTFNGFVSQLGERFLEGGGAKVGRPKTGSIPYFISYFWQIQDRLTWPVYYTNTVNTLSDLSLWHPRGEIAEDYIAYKTLHEELARLFTAASGEQFDFWEVEHVFWLKGGNPFGGDRPLAREPAQRDVRGMAPGIHSETQKGLPESYVPPVIAVLPLMARNDTPLQDAARSAGTSLERAFEKNVDAAFAILGYETKLMGQGKGRVPDGVASSPEDLYAIIWDAKAREKAYSMGTDDRAIREYVATQSRELRKRGTLRNIYYVIISSRFADDFDDTIRSIKMETHVNEVVLVEAEALVTMVDAKLREPRSLTLGSDGIQRLFSDSGVLRSEDVKELLS